MDLFHLPSRSLVVSIVSHGHGALVQPLLHDMARLAGASVGRVVLTLNLPEAEPVAPVQGWPFALDLVRNAQPAAGPGAEKFTEQHNVRVRSSTKLRLNRAVDRLRYETGDRSISIASLTDAALCEYLDKRGI